jgi:uroporphyrinogen-III synthase
VSALPLEGRKILVTRARHQAGRLSEELRARGAEVVEVPAIEIEPPDSWEGLDRAIRQIPEYQWLIVTSANAVRSLRERMRVLQVGSEALAHLRIAAVGSATAGALREAGLEPEVVPREYVAESLIEALGAQVRGQRVLLARAAIARDLIPDALRAREASVEVVDAYRTVIPLDSIEQIRRLFEGVDPLPDAATFTSSSTVTNFLALLEAAGVSVPPGMRAISIGPITSRTLRERGLEPAAEAEPHDLEGLVQAVVRVLGGA